MPNFKGAVCTLTSPTQPPRSCHSRAVRPLSSGSGVIRVASLEAQLGRMSPLHSWVATSDRRTKLLPAPFWEGLGQRTQPIDFSLLLVPSWVWPKVGGFQYQKSGGCDLVALERPPQQLWKPLELLIGRNCAHKQYAISQRFLCPNYQEARNLAGLLGSGCEAEINVLGSNADGTGHQGAADSHRLPI